ncbi:MAG: selenocysteine-specific translation elongation factor [Pyrinomonadaceae bacterium]
MHIIVGTAGHIDHGKTALVKALTGTDADRLPEEKQRGITIDLGFAELSEGDARISFIDVPGHERFVKNMLAGASGIDVVLLVVAADEGVMPQTREHFDICRLLRVRRGVVALTKSDLVDDETLEIAREDVAELVAGSFLEGAPVVPVSSRTGAGIERLREVLLDAVQSAPPRADDSAARLPIDRSFSVKGFGAVVTGTLAAGKIVEGSELELLPPGRRVRVRGVQSHGRSVSEAAAGRRTAVNLGGIDHHEIHRGMTLAEPGVLRPAQMFDAEVEVLADAPRPLRTRQRVRVHIGTAELLARVEVLDPASAEIAAGGRGFVQLRLESPAVAVTGERFIIRSYSPQATIAGGAVLRPASERPRRKAMVSYVELLSKLSAAAGDKPTIVKRLVTDSGAGGLTIADIRAITGWRQDVAAEALSRSISAADTLDANGVHIAASAFDRLAAAAVAAIDRHHKQDPLSKGLPLDALRERVFKFVPAEVQRAVVASLVESGKASLDKDAIRSAGHRAELSPGETAAIEKLRSIFRGELNVPKLDEALAEAARAGRTDAATARKLLKILTDTGEIRQVTPEFYFAAAVLDDLVQKLRRFADASADRLIDVPAFKDLAGVSRKYAIPLLEYFDRTKVTARRGDKRYIL